MGPMLCCRWSWRISPLAGSILPWICVCRTRYLVCPQCQMLLQAKMAHGRLLRLGILLRRSNVRLEGHEEWSQRHEDWRHCLRISFSRQTGQHIAATMSAIFIFSHSPAKKQPLTQCRVWKKVALRWNFLRYVMCFFLTSLKQAQTKQPTQVGNLTSNALEEKLSRDELGKILDNLHLHQMATFISSAETTGKDRLKAMKRKLRSPDKLRKASAGCLQQLSSALRGGFNFGSLAITLKSNFSKFGFKKKHAAQVWKYFSPLNVCCLDKCLPSFSTMLVQRWRWCLTRAAM